jgi:hypothetical protein
VIKQDVTIGAGQRQSLAQLLDNPVGGRMGCAIEVQNSSSAVFNDKERVERSKAQRGNRKEVEGGDDLAVVVQKRQSSFRLALVISAPDASKVRETVGSETLNPSWTNSPWMRGAPQPGFSAFMRRISWRISLVTFGRPGWRDSPSPKQTEAGTMPGHNGFRFDD